jgi:hypothetical protein
MQQRNDPEEKGYIWLISQRMRPRIGDGPAAVTGDDRSIKATDSNSWIGKALSLG